MTIRNTPDAAALEAMTPAELREYGAALAKTAAEFKGDLDAFNAVVARRFGRDVAAAYEAEDKQAGTVRVKVADGVELKADTSKTVEWDQDALMAIAGTMDWATARHWFTFKIGLPEKRFDSLPPGDLRDRITAARTVKYGAPKLTLASPNA
jgi:hypothetical protein